MFSALQIWARYLEGDNISTKIELSLVEIEIGEASSTFWKIEIEIGEASSTFWKIEIKIGEASPIDLAHIWFLGIDNPNQATMSYRKFSKA